MLVAQEYAGYARRLAGGPSVDFGVTHSNYSEYYGGGGSAQYTEIYGGVIARHFASHLYYSPNYFSRHEATLYGEIDGAVEPARDWRLSAHAGVLTRLTSSTYSHGRPTQFDWRLGVARALKAFEVELAWSGAGPDRDYYQGAPRHRSGILVALKHAF
jgi:uncharacterized protein (TIGR02001 family)